MRLLAVLAAAVMVAGCGGAEHTVVPAGAIAVVGETPIPKADFDAQLDQARRAYRAQGKAFPAPGTRAYRRLRDSAVRLLVEREQMLVAARRLGILPQVMDQVAPELRRFKQRTFGGSDARYRQRLLETGMTEGDVRRAITDQLLAAALEKAKPSASKKLLPVSYAKGFIPAANG